jgi:hypothetical protein
MSNMIIYFCVFTHKLKSELHFVFGCDSVYNTTNIFQRKLLPFSCFYNKTENTYSPPTEIS